jgi:hypothetical protein
MLHRFPTVPTWNYQRLSESISSRLSLPSPPLQLSSTSLATVLHLFNDNVRYQHNRLIPKFTKRISPNRTLRDWNAQGDSFAHPLVSGLNSVSTCTLGSQRKSRKSFDHCLRWARDTSGHTMISYRSLPLRSLVMNRVGTRMAFQVSPRSNPTGHQMFDLTTH